MLMERPTPSLSSWEGSGGKGLVKYAEIDYYRGVLVWESTTSEGAAFYSKGKVRITVSSHLSYEQALIHDIFSREHIVQSNYSPFRIIPPQL